MKSHIKHNRALALRVPEPLAVEQRAPQWEWGGWHNSEPDFQAACRLQVTALGNDFEVLDPVPNLQVFCSTRTEEEASGPQDFTHRYRACSFPSSSEYRRAGSLCVSNQVLYLLFSQREPDCFVNVTFTSSLQTQLCFSSCQHNGAVQATLMLPQVSGCFGCLEDRMALCGSSAKWQLGDNVQVSM